MKKQRKIIKKTFPIFDHRNWLWVSSTVILYRPFGEEDADVYKCKEGSTVSISDEEIRLYKTYEKLDKL